MVFFSKLWYDLDIYAKRRDMPMWKQKIGICLYNNYGRPTTEVIDLLKQTGFEAISPEWEPDVNVKELVDHARSIGLEVQSLHAPYTGSHHMWESDPALYEPAYKDLLDSLHVAAENNIPILVIHAWIGFIYTMKPNADGFANFDRLVDEATKLGVKIAIENTEGGEFLTALMDHYKDNENVGFCWDSGHEMCYNHSEDLLALYGDRLIMTHLNDNLGIRPFEGNVFWHDDLHLLPYDGVGDWDYNIDRMKASRKMDILNFELNINSKPDRHENDVYTKMPLEQYFAEAYKRACRVAYRYSR